MASYSRSLALLSGLGNKEAEGGGRWELLQNLEGPSFSAAA